MKNAINTLEKIKNLVANDNLRQALNDLKLFVEKCKKKHSYSKGFDSHSHSVLLMLSRLNKLQKDCINGTITEPEIRIERLQISKSLLNTATWIEEIIKERRDNVKNNKMDENVLVTLNIERDFNTYSEKDKHSLLKAIEYLLELEDEVIIKKITSGSVLITLELPNKKAELLRKIFEDGELKKFNVTNVELVKSDKILLKKNKDRILRTVIIDDEKLIRAHLHNLLLRYCPTVKVVAFADSVPTGVETIQKYKPDLVFLDVGLKLGSGFEILNALQKYDFEVVMTLAHTQYGVKALKYSAINILLKPIDIQELISIVNKLIDSKNANTYLDKKWKVLKNNLSTVNNQKIAIIRNQSPYFINDNDIVFCESVGNYTIFNLNKRPNIISIENLKHYEDILDMKMFFRISQHHLANINYVKYEKTGKLFVELKDGKKLYVSSHKEEALYT